MASKSAKNYVLTKLLSNFISSSQVILYHFESVSMKSFKQTVKLNKPIELKILYSKLCPQLNNQLWYSCWKKLFATRLNRNLILTLSFPECWDPLAPAFSFKNDKLNFALVVSDCNISQRHDTWDKELLGVFSKLVDSGSPSESVSLDDESYNNLNSTVKRN